MTVRVQSSPDASKRGSGVLFTHLHPQRISLSAFPSLLPLVNAMQTRSERRSNFKDFKGQVDLYPGSKYPHQLNLLVYRAPLTELQLG